MLRVVTSTIIALLVILTGSAERASGMSTVVFSNLNAGTYSANEALSISGSSTFFEFDQGGSFTPSADYTLDSISAALTHSAGTNAIDLSLMSDDAGVPGAVIESWSFVNLPQFGTTNTALAAGSSTLHPLLMAGTPYWVVASAGAADSDMGFNLNTLGQKGRAFKYGGSWTFDGTSNAPAFQVEGTLAAAAVPEPSTVLLMGLGLVGLGYAGQRKLVS